MAATVRGTAMTGVTKDAKGESAQRMQCMEVWGGNCEIDRSFEMPGLHTWVCSQPHGGSQGGGDVYYVSSCASGRITRLLLADVSGHGAAVSELALGLRGLMRKNVNVVKQTRFVEGMNQQFTRLSESGAFATALVATFFQPTNRMTLCNAGHPSPLRYSVETASWSRIESPTFDDHVVSGTPLGVCAQAAYPQVETVLDAGDMVLLFSDALTESLDEKGAMLGEEGLLQLVSRLPAETPDLLIRRLVSQVKESSPNQQVGDDLTIVLIQATGTSTRLSDNLLALFRLMRPVGDSTAWNNG